MFDPKKDFVALGFRKIDTDNIYIGVSKWIYDGRPAQLLGQGIIAVEDTNNLYELVNVSKRNIKLIASEIENLGTKSYFTNTIVNIVIEYLGRMCK